MTLAEKHPFTPVQRTRQPRREAVRPVNPRDGQRITPGHTARLLAGAAELLFRTPLWRLSLGGRRSRRTTVAPTDLWPGDGERGRALLAGTLVAGPIAAPLPTGPLQRAGRPTDPQTAGEGSGPWAIATRPDDWIAALHGFRWLRDLRAVGGNEARQRARDLTTQWLDRYERYDRLAWRSDILAERLAAWLGLWGFFADSADDAFQRRLAIAAGRQASHLCRAITLMPPGVSRIHGLKALVLASATLTRAERCRSRALSLLDRELERQVLADGGHASRAPSAGLAVFRDLIDIRTALLASPDAPLQQGEGLPSPVPDVLQTALDRMAPALRLLRHGDGALALFHGGQTDLAWQLDLALAQADARGRTPQNLPHSGYRRVHAGRGLLLFDAGPPPGPGFDARGHAGTLAFEFSLGRDRLITNCGAPAANDTRWAFVLRATAAHSTITLCDTNTCEICPDGALGRRPENVIATREERDGKTWLEASHDGYGRAFGLVHRRRLWLAGDGCDLRGEDSLEPVLTARGTRPGRRGDTIAAVARFHLHPAIKASLVQGGQQVLLRLPSGDGWQFRTGGGELALAESVYMGDGESQRRSQQITVSWTIAPDVATAPARATLQDGGVHPSARLRWSLRRLDKG
jgi:uncharacterized heparinase superfamily protein